MAGEGVIAVGISGVINCDACMPWHIGQAAKAGATRRQVLEAVEEGIAMGVGPPPPTPASRSR